MTAAAITKPCTACKSHFIGLASHTLCPNCEKDQDFYKRTRKRGDKRAFIPYPELLQQWKARRAECKSWRTAVSQMANDWMARKRLEREKSLMLEVIDRLAADSEPLLAMADELATIREELARSKASAELWQSQYEGLRETSPPDFRFYELIRDIQASKAHSAIPPDMRRRLIQLCHPDRHQGSEASQIATRWLLEGRE